MKRFAFTGEHSYHGPMQSLKSILLSADPVGVLREFDASGKLQELEPSLAGLRMSIPAGYHHKDNLTHSLQVLQNAIDRETEGTDLVLRTAALFHDVGKPDTRKFGRKGLVTFDGHETVGAYQIRKILKRHGYEKSQIEEIAKIVAFHMRSHGFTAEQWTDSAVRRLMTEVGDAKTMQRLVVVFYADITTKYDDKRQKLHASVDELVKAMAAVRDADARKALRPAVDGHEIMTTFQLSPGPELGKVMKFLNSDEGVKLTKEEALAEVRARFF